MADAVLKAHEYERDRIGQELHDSAGQLLVSLHLSLAHLRDVEKSGAHEALLADMQRTVGQLDREIRTLSFLHHPAELGEAGLCSAVGILARGFGRRTGISTTFKCFGDQSPVDPSISSTLLRVAQEALVNIHRHSHATAVHVVLENRGACIRLAVSDNGIGIVNLRSVTDSEGVGLQGMRHRIQLLNGRFRIRNLKRGAKVTASVPLAA
ncbi:MAG: sensor histidine kinase [Sphingomicrobium sp.]